MSDSRITSEKIIQDSLEHQIKLEKHEQSIEDLEELRSLQLKKRREYEQQLNKNRLNFGQWIRYAKWEIEFCHDFQRARSIYERALQVNVEHVPFWINYIKFELSNNNINHARNLLDRAIATLPNVDKFWFLYVQTEETLQNYSKVRQLFKSWIHWKPPAAAWEAFINFEKRYDEVDNARGIFQEFVVSYPQGSTWNLWIDFELSKGDSQYTRNVFEIAVDNILQNDPNDKSLSWIIEQWAAWELKEQEFERANEIFKLILDKTKFSFQPEQYLLLLHAFTSFESKYGDENSLNANILLKRKLKYISNVEKNPQDIDSWWLLLDLLHGDELKEYFDRAISPENVPPEKEKTIVWRRYIFLWIRYSLYLEYTLKEVEKARELWNQCLKVVPKQIIFGKIWILYCEFEIRNSSEGIGKARKVLGRAIGSMVKPKDKIFKYYVELEKKLGEWDRVRKIYEKWFELSLIKDVKALRVLLEYIEFEKELQEFDRCEALFKAGIEMILVDLVAQRLSPFDYLYMSFVEYYKDQFEYPKARDLFESLLKDYDSVKIWIAYANFESSIPNDDQIEEFNANNDNEFEFELEDAQKNSTRAIYKRALEYFKSQAKDEERVIILESWKNYEETNGDNSSIDEVSKKMPQIVKRTKLENNVHKEYLEYIFPNDKPAMDLSKFLQNAKKWADSNEK